MRKNILSKEDIIIWNEGGVFCMKKEMFEKQFIEKEKITYFEDGEFDHLKLNYGKQK